MQLLGKEKALTQTERKLLLTCCEALHRPFKQAELGRKEIDVDHLIEKLSEKTNNKAFSCIQKIRQIFLSIITLIPNALHLRVSDDRLEKSVHETFTKLDLRKKIDPAYKEIISTLMKQPNVDQAQRTVALKVSNPCFCYPGTKNRSKQCITATLLSINRPWNTLMKKLVFLLMH